MNRLPCWSLSFLFAIAAAGLAGGCSSFNREWEAASAVPSNSNDITGCWHGSWVSEADGHTGDLKCVVTEPCERRYRAHFMATYFRVFHFEYALNLSATPPADGRIAFSGRENLGWLAGGIYDYQGAASSTDFQCNYRSKYDFGRFTMKRP